VVQESLTNVLKHAGPASVVIDLNYGVRALEMRVSDDGTKAKAYRESPTAHGIRGMRERAELYGGVLTLQRHSGEWVAASFVVAEAGLVLASPAPDGPGPDVFGGMGGPQRQVDQQAADFR
jgi:nitrate/nitrite-specific signal transduction histidine kinase